MKVYSPSDMAEILQIKPATLRKYSILLEKYGYSIERNSQGHRFYQDKDIITLRNIIRGRNSGATLEETIINVVKLEGNSNVPNDTNNGNETNNNDIAELKEMVHKQNENIEELKHYIKDSIEARDKMLMETMNKIMEDKKERLEGPKINNKDNNNKSWFSRLFKRK